MARTKYTFEKRQRELARHKKQEEKAARRAEARKGHAQTEQSIVDDEPIPANVEAESQTDR
jgi:hypothetical protein